MTTNVFRAREQTDKKASVKRLVKLMTGAAWAALIIGLVLSLWNINHFSDQNASLMVGVGFMVASVHIYVIRTAIHLVHARSERSETPDGGVNR
ncbi:hypothetical protein [Paenibacillus thermotolerans]|uniref:hypothetical protein n=1 Tax=Paenibacillus thermotolerans TaxID=3027807 RepID=UPI0023681E3F|nr:MULTISPECIES: hypothetical protein [unclassified Paenibacillus]